MIAIQAITKHYGKQLVLNNISLDVPANEICCLLGRNGAGKSTMLNIITQEIKQDKGEVFIMGQPFTRQCVLVKSKIGVVSQSDYLIDQLTGMQYLQFNGLIHNMPKEEISKRAIALNQYFFENDTEINKPIHSFSSGMRMKLNIITALLHQPDILIMDEPFANLDMVSCEKLSLLLLEFMQQPGKVVLVSSHDLLYVEKIATRICVIDKQQIVFNGTREEFASKGTDSMDKQLLQLLQPQSIELTNIKALL